VWSASRLGRLYPRERPGTHCTGDVLDRCAKSRPTGIRSPDFPTRSESLYGLSYPGSELCVVIFFFCIYLTFAITCVITAVVFMREAGRAQAVSAHWVTKDRDSISDRNKRLFFSLKHPPWLLGPVSNICNGYRVHLLPLVKAAGTCVSPISSTWC
jgi:hypothetical protein